LEVGDFRFSAPKPGYGSLGLQLFSFWCVLGGLSPSVAGRFRPLQLYQRRGSRALNPTSPALFSVGFGLDFSRFARCYCGNPVLVSFPPPTKMLPFGGFPLREGASTPKSRIRSLIQVPPVLWLHAPTRGVSPLAAPFVSSQAEPFSRRRVMSGLWWCLLAFGENLYFVSYVCVAVVCAWCHSESLLRRVRFTLHSVFLRAWSCMFLMAWRSMPRLF
jgi:hypothetical protein